MTGDPNTDRSPRSPSDDERLATQRAHSPRVALMDRLDLLAGGIRGAAAYQAALRLLPNGARSSGTKPPPGARWNRTEGAFEVDHAAAMRLWEPRDGAGLPPREMVDAFLAGYVERTGDDVERQLVLELYAEAEQRLADRGGAAEIFPASTRDEAATVAERYGYGKLVQTITLDTSSGTFLLALVLVVVPALLGTMLLFQSDGGTSSRVGGIALYVVAVAAIFFGFVPLPLGRPRPPDPQLFVFRGGIVFAVNGLLDPYAWPDLELYQSAVTSTVGQDQREVRTNMLVISSRGRSMRFVVPSFHHETVTDLARAGGASIS
ncbi:hypothetical protein ACQEVI_05745 [Promicromonospora sp. CA-289599]|uniref:hypothetical protein n=1 Tax=Promicromonospora sp. CA-289599 TaxID=3240014 RepID=UPI003D917A3F